MFQACQQQWHSRVSVDPVIWWVLIHSTKPHVHTNMLSNPDSIRSPIYHGYTEW